MKRILLIWVVSRGVTPRSPTALATIGVVMAVVLALTVITALLVTGGPSSVSTNAALIGALVALGGVFTTQLVNSGLEAQRAREAALQKYIEQMGKLLTDSDRPLHRSALGDTLSTVARAHTLTVLEGLDPARKRMLLLFLHESNLIKAAKPIISLRGADLRGADLHEVALYRANLSGADLRVSDLRGVSLLGETNLSGATLSGADLRGATLTGANVSDTYMMGADLRGAVLLGAKVIDADLEGAVLRGAILRWADLSGAKNLPQEQIDQANGDGTTKLPDHLQRPTHWPTTSPKDGEE